MLESIDARQPIIDHRQHTRVSQVMPMPLGRDDLYSLYAQGSEAFKQVTSAEMEESLAAY
jgi:hypothetical protein